MLVIVGIILLLLWLFDYAVHLTAGSLIDLLLIFATISFALDFLRDRSPSDRRPDWDHRPPKAHRRRIVLAARWLRHRVRGFRSPS
jgi:amino acid transporter